MDELAFWQSTAILGAVTSWAALSSIVISGYVLVLMAVLS